MNIKICGITRAQDALLAAQRSAWAIGFIFYDKSARSVSIAVASEIVKQLNSLGHQKVFKVGVFVNETLESVLSTARAVGLTTVQLHGEESVEYCRKLQNEKLKIIKAFRPQSEADLEVMSDYSFCDYFLIDSYDSHQRGGTGVKGDWHLAQSAAKKFSLKVILAGGLRPDNVSLAIKEVSPFAVDVSSGVEISPGVKDLEKVDLFFKNAEAFTSGEIK